LPGNKKIPGRARIGNGNHDLFDRDSAVWHLRRVSGNRRLCFRQIRLHPDVVSGEAFGRIHLQGAAVGGHRLGQQFIALRTPGTEPLRLEPVAQVGLDGCPILRQPLAGVNLQGVAVSRNGVRQMFISCLAFPSNPEFRMRAAPLRPELPPIAADRPHA
jgi:hypothetical protein